MQKNQLLGMPLPDPNAPFYNPHAALYVGTQEEFQQFADRLEATPQASYYKDAIAAIRAYPNDPSVSYKIAGNEYTIEPVTEIGRKDFSLSDHEWIYKTSNRNAQHVMRASYVWVSYVIATYKHWTAICCKAQFENPSISMPGIGWVSLSGTSRGTPGLFYPEANDEDDTYTVYMPLYRSERWYSQYEKAPTVEDLPKPTRINLSTVLQELLGRF